MGKIRKRRRRMGGGGDLFEMGTVKPLKFKETNFGGWLKVVRETVGVTQLQLAAALGFKNRHPVKRLEENRRRYSLDLLVKLSKYLEKYTNDQIENNPECQDIELGGWGSLKTRQLGQASAKMLREKEAAEIYMDGEETRKGGVATDEYIKYAEKALQGQLLFLMHLDSLMDEINRGGSNGEVNDGKTGG